MQRPTAIRTMLLLLYFKLAMHVVFIVTVISQGNFQENFEKSAAMAIAQVALPPLLFVAMIGLVRNRKMLVALLTVLVMMNFNTDGVQFVTTIALVLFFFLPSVRRYFRNPDAQTGAGSEQPRSSAGNRKINFAKKGEANDEATDQTEAPEAEVGAEATTPVKSKLGREHTVEIREATAKEADIVHTLMLASFEEYRTAIPPSSALEETEESIREALVSEREYAVILIEDNAAVATVRYSYVDDVIYFFRLSVIPAKRRRGYAKQLVKWIERQGVTKGMNISRCKVRQSVKNNLVLYQNMGYEIVDQELIVRPAGTIKALTLEKKLGV